MFTLRITALLITLASITGFTSAAVAPDSADAVAGWVKFDGNPVLGGDLGTCFDISVLRESGKYRMWFSWRPKASVALTESADGIHWSEPTIVLSPNHESGWEEDINRPVVLKREKHYEMFYTGQARGRSWIGFAESPDGVNWTRRSKNPVLSPEVSWEHVAVMCPHVLYEGRRYKMWYSGGAQGEPNAIGYAESPDGLRWTKRADNPIFRPDPENAWEKDRVTACQVIRERGWYVMFYIGFEDESFARIGIARSRDGVTNWERHPANPILRSRTMNTDAWDHDAVYKPYAIWDGSRWMLWYNGRRSGVEQIGLAIHPGRDLWP